MGSGWQRVMKVAVVGLAFVVGWNTLLGFVFSPSAIYDGSALPSRLHACDRDWNRDGLRPQTLGAIEAEYSPGPTLVTPLLAGFLSPCPSAACSRDANHFPCDTVVYVRIGEDAYQSYSLVGGP